MSRFLVLLTTLWLPSGPFLAANWETQTTEDAKQDRTTLIFDGKSPDKLVCDTTLRAMSDGSWVMVMLGGGDTEPRPQNGIKEVDLKSYLRTRDEQGHNWLRAAEIRSPAPPGHYLREFGQSDRETIENANDQASVPQALALMNGDLLRQIMNRFSQLTLTVSKAKTPDDKVNAVYLALLSRKPTPKEKVLWREAQSRDLSRIEDLIFCLLNTQQFIFVQ